MEKYYYAWKDRNCNGINVTWVKLDGRSFYEMISQPENKNRRFVRLGDAQYGDEEIYYFEVTKEEYTDWVREHNRGNYLHKYEDQQEIVSLDAIEHRLAQWKDESIDIERDTIATATMEELAKRMEGLEDTERQLLMKHYYENIGIVELSKEYGMTHQAMSRKIQSIRNKLITDL